MNVGIKRLGIINHDELLYLSPSGTPDASDIRLEAELPSCGPLRLVKAPAAVHPLPEGPKGEGPWGARHESFRD